MPRSIFLSSTCFDLLDVRAELKSALEAMGHKAFASETPDFPVNSSLKPADNCLEVLRTCDIYLLIVNTRYGSPFDGDAVLKSPVPLPGGYLSITLAEYLTARAAGLEIRIWVRDSIWSSNPRFGHPPPIPDTPQSVDTAVYDLLDFIVDNPDGGAWINQFHDVTDLKQSIVHWLEEREYPNELAFKRAVADLLEIQGYDFDRDFLLEPGQAFTHATLSTDPFGAQYGVWCYYSRTGATIQWSDVQHVVLEAHDKLERRNVDRAFIVTNQRLAAIRDHLRDLPSSSRLLVEALDDVLARLINFRPYIGRIVEDYEHFDRFTGEPVQADPIISIMRRCDLYKHYVPLRAVVESGDHTVYEGSLADYIDKWLQHGQHNHLTILGDFGTGKSSFALWLTYQLSRRALESDSYDSRIPVFVSLRDHVGKIDIREVITNTLVNTYGLRDAHFSSFTRLLDAGRLVLIFDGFDETATMTDRATALDILRNINALVRRRSKIILTCRTHYFRSREETAQHLEHSLSPRDTELFLEHKGRTNYHIATLKELMRDQIELFVKSHCDHDEERTRRTLAEMNRVYNLRDLARRPVMLEMILKVWPRLRSQQGRGDITPATLYEEYTQEWINHVAKGNQDLIDTAAKAAFCDDLTKWMYRRNQELLPFSELEKVVVEHFHDRPPAAYGALDTEIRTCSFLNRDSVGNYQFAHRSFMEFFVARLCASEIARGDYDLLRLRPATYEILNFLRGLVAETETLWSVVNWTRNAAEAGYAGGNAATLLRAAGETFTGRDLSNTVLAAADLTNTDLTDADLRGADLRDAKLRNCTLVNADLRNADLSQIVIGEMQEVTCLAWSDDRRLLAVGGNDQNVRIWNSATWELVAILRGHTAAIQDVSFGRKSSRLFSLAKGSEVEVVVWDTRGLQLLCKLDGSTVSTEGESEYRVTRVGAFVHIRDDNGAYRLRSFRPRAFYSTLPRYTVQVQGNTVLVYDWETGGNEIFRSPTLDAAVRCVNYAADDSAVAAGTADGRVHVWDPLTWEEVALLEEKPVSCDGLKIAGARGLGTRGYATQRSRNGTLRDWFRERGAISKK